MQLVIGTRDAIAPESQAVEFVERKGLGHPDTICDAIAEHVCVRLCRHYLDRFGVVLHHNVDKILLCGGSARAALGGGEVLRPIEIFIAGRAVQHHRGERIPVQEIAVEAAREWLDAHLRCLDLDRHVRIHSRIGEGSADLTHLFSREGALANDTSLGAGFAPLSELERAVLSVERVLNAATTKHAHPAIGEDIKVMGVRNGTAISLTIGCAVIDRFVSDARDYLRTKALIGELARDTARAQTKRSVEVAVNAADDVDAGSLYLTVTGTSAESGDDGEVGRGNRVSGLITPLRPMTMEAAAGKNPVTHVGKLYNIIAGRIAADMVSRLEGVHHAECILVSQIGRPVADPQLVSVQLNAGAADGLEPHVTQLVRDHLGRFEELRHMLLAEQLALF